MPTDGTRQTVYLAADLPGMNINFLDVDDKAVPTKGRMLDHIGFEVRDLEAFTRKLAANGVNVVQPYRRNSGDAIATALLVDPWGTSIELTEGLSGYRDDIGVPIRDIGRAPDVVVLAAGHRDGKGELLGGVRPQLDEQLGPFPSRHARNKGHELTFRRSR